MSGGCVLSSAWSRDKHLAQSEDDSLKALLGDSQGLYEITLLKRDPRDFSNDEIKGEIGRGDWMRPFITLPRNCCLI